jgi:membrane-bound lytic murein transglycosylase D
MPVVLNDRVRTAIRYYTGRARSPFALWLDRSGRYIGMMQEILTSYGLPRDLAWLSLVESGFSPWAYSRAHAAGLWQFIRATAQLYGLRVTWWVDERRDPVKATHAAARYLRDLHAKLGSWPLALAAYNCGEGRVRRRIAREHTNDYWSLRRLPRQTRGFVPRYMAATILAKDPEVFGFDVRPLAPMDYETITVDGPVDIRVTAECLGVEYEELKELNPELTRWCTPPGDPHYDLRVPLGATPRYLARLSSIRHSAPDTYIQHRVKKGESLWRISRRYGVPIATLAEVNELRNRNRIGIGQTIMVPMPASDAPYRRPPSVASTALADSSPAGPRSGEHPGEDAPGGRPWSAMRASRFPVLEATLQIEPPESTPEPTAGG